MKIIYTAINDIVPYANNAKVHPERQLKQVANSITEFGFNQPIVVDKENVIIVGHGRWMAAKQIGLKEVPVLMLDMSEEKAKAYRLADNKLNESEWDMGLVIDELKKMTDEMIEFTGFDKSILEEEQWRNETKASLREAYIIPPFSVWDAKQQYWQDRKKMWTGYIGHSGEGRDELLLGPGLQGLAKKTSKNTTLTGTSIFDPVVAEISYRWFCPPNGTILDPFAGGNVRGSVASILGYDYVGIDLSERQVIANRKKAEALEITPTYIHENSINLDKVITEKKDFIFSCPPYFDLEQYNDGDGDISMYDNYSDFLRDYKIIIKKAVDCLKDNRFAVWVVGDVRDKKGNYYGLVKDTIDAFREAGMSLYNEIILVNSLATAPLRAKKPFDTNRKVTKVHQNVLCFTNQNVETMEKIYNDIPQLHQVHKDVYCFYKGDINEIKENYKAVNSDLDFM